MARPSKLNEQLVIDFCKEVEDGLPICYVCDLFGITESTYRNWLDQGRDDYENDVESIHAEFFAGIKKSYALFVKHSQHEMKTKEKGWQAVAWWLERTNNFFMPKQQIQADDEGKVTVVIGGKQKTK